METTPAQHAERGSKRKRNFIILLIILLLAAGGGVAWYLLYARYYESTDDAYVNGNQVTLTPQIGGTVTQVTVDEGDFVAEGAAAGAA
nr:auxiliary transport protein, membrane fusion protein (MFP) family [Raoultella sp. NCTC 9187]